MGVVDQYFKDNIKLAFSRVKEHILHIEGQLKSNKEEVEAYKEEIRLLRKELKSLRESIGNKGRSFEETQNPPEPQNQAVEQVSSGNEGVYSFIHSLNKHSFNSYSDTKQTLNTHFQKFDDFKQDFDKIFSNVSKQEFLTFLTIYQLEEEMTHVGYIAVANKLNLTEGCIRTYVSSLLKKGLPLMKKKYNNKQVFLYISPEFRSLNLKQKLIDTFYHFDPNQKTLV
ncbi:MAG: hypothetical protein KKA79_00310 [Nanoarchaeota archaeon]|nr:hypothetical protein [Nanoarchaeota archaeon]